VRLRDLLGRLSLMILFSQSSPISKNFPVRGGPGFRGARHRAARSLVSGRAFARPIGADPLAPSGLRSSTQPYVLARNGGFVEPDQSDLPCPAPVAKIFPFPPDPNHFYIRRRPVPQRGARAIVTDAGRDAVDADSAVRRPALEVDGEVVWS
jgi:hypothetical protein